MPRERKRPGRAVLEAAQRHQDALEAAGLPAKVLEQYESAVRGLASQERPLSGVVQVLVRDVQREVDAGIKKVDETIAGKEKDLMQV